MSVCILNMKFQNTSSMGFVLERDDCTDLGVCVAKTFAYANVCQRLHCRSNR
jgi:hypothetical protein